MNNSRPTGQERLAKNVLASYAGHFVFILFGFIMPRIIDSQVGQVGLGIWDLGWSIVSYLSLSMVGIGSSVNRFVARFRDSEDYLALGRLVSTVIAVQLVIAGFVLLCSIALFLSIPVFFAEQLGEFADNAGWVIGLLGTSLAVQMAFDSWRGVLSGCHRWDYYNAINAGGYAVSALVMISILLLGGGLKGIAASYLLITLATEFVRFLVARKVCPELKVSRKAINLADAKIVIRFGVKTSLLAIPGVLVIQTVSMFIVASLGPAALAVLARPLSLMSHITTLMNKYAFVLTPVASSIQGQQDSEELSDFALRHARNGWILATPPLVYLFVFGDAVLEIWMGPDYAIWSSTAILSAGFLLPISQSPVLRILTGMDMHGRVAKTSLLIAGSVLAAGIFFGVTFGWSMELAVSVIALAVGLGTGVNVLIHGFAVLGWSVRKYFERVLVDALWLMFWLSISLLLVRLYLRDSHYGSLLIVGALSTLVVASIAQRDDIRKLFQTLFPKIIARRRQ